MKAKTFISLMLLLLAFTICLLAFSAPQKQAAPQEEYPANATPANNTQAQASEGSMMLESVSRHLLNAMQ